MPVKIKSWAKFQHFKDRKPPWVKLYRDLLDDKEWFDLDPKAAKILVMLWLIASEDDGRIPDASKLAFRLRASETEVKSALSKLSHWLEQDDIGVISKGYQNDAPERETERETETEEPTVLVGLPDGESAPPAQVLKLTDRRVPCPADALLEAFHAECPTLPRVIKLNDKRRTHLTARWREVDAESKFASPDDGIEVFRGVFRKVHGSDFLTGRSKQNGRSWSASFDWLFESSTNFLKVCEGQYDNEPPRQRTRSEWTIGAA